MYIVLTIEVAKKKISCQQSKVNVDFLANWRLYVCRVMYTLYMYIFTFVYNDLFWPFEIVRQQYFFMVYSTCKNAHRDKTIQILFLHVFSSFQQVSGITHRNRIQYRNAKQQKTEKVNIYYYRISEKLRHFIVQKRRFSSHPCEKFQRLFQRLFFVVPLY